MPTLRNCVLQYRCPNNWDDLTETVDQDIRFCGECQKEVHFCDDDDELIQNIHLNRCIAINRVTTIEMGYFAPENNSVE